MTPLLDVVVRVSLLLAAGLLASVLLRRRSAALRHAVLAATLLATPMLPLVSAMFPPIDVPGPTLVRGPATPPPGDTVVPADATPTASTSPAATDEPGGLTWSGLAAMAWVLGSGIALARMGLWLWRLARGSRMARPVTSARWLSRLHLLRVEGNVTCEVRLLLTDRNDVLAVWGWPRAHLLLPMDALSWDDDRIDAVLRHELAHVRRADWLVHLLASLVRAGLWWHPLAWLAYRRLEAESERACDDAVLAQGADPSTYAEHLVAIARALHPSRAAALTVPMASPSTLHRRIVAMLNPALDRTPPARATVATIAAVALTLVLSLGLVRAEQTAQTLQGVAYDPTGAVMPGITVTLQTGDTKATSATDAAGQFVFAAVPPGRHVLEVKVPGFKAYRQELDLQRDGDWERTVTMQVGQVQESIRITGKRGAAPTVAPAGPTPVRVGGNIRPPRKLKDVKPVYPTAMREAGREARVVLDAVIGADGRVMAARVTSPDVHPDFAVAAVDAVRQWQFSPTLLNGAPIDIVMTVSIEFTLE